MGKILCRALPWLLLLASFSYFTEKKLLATEVIMYCMCINTYIFTLRYPILDGPDRLPSLIRRFTENKLFSTKVLLYCICTRLFVCSSILGKKRLV
jgi:hypothetical protein